MINNVTITKVTNGYIVIADDKEYIANSIKHSWALGGVSVESILDSLFNPPKEPNPIDKEDDVINP